MQQFKHSYDQIQGQDNFAQLETHTLGQIVAAIVALIKEGRIYKGKSGENFRIYTLRLLECFAMCEVKL